MASSTTFQVRPMRHGDLEEAARLHVDAFPGFFLSELGRSFLYQFYRGHMEDPTSVSLIAEDSNGGLLGVVVGSHDPKGFYSRLARRRWLQFMIASGPLLVRRPQALVRVARGLLYRGDEAIDPEAALLSSICVDPSSRGRGVGRALVAEWCGEMASRGVGAAFLSTDASENDQVNRFYADIGWKHYVLIERQAGRRMNILRRDLGPSSDAVRAKIRVLHVVAGDAYGGASRVISSVASAMNTRYNVEVVTTEPRLADDLSNAGLPVHEIAIARRIRPIHDAVSVLRLVRLIRNRGYSVVHTHTSKGGAVGRVAAWLARVPVRIHTVHNVAVGDASSARAVAANKAIERSLARITTGLTTVSSVLGSQVDGWRLQPSYGSHVIRNGLPDVHVHPGPARPCPLVLYHGRLAAAKGIEDLLLAAASLYARGFQFDLAIVGDGELRTELQGMAADLGFTDDIFWGFRSDVACVLSQADICVQPSLREGLSIALLEAMRAGRCALVSDIPANLEVLGSPMAGAAFAAGVASSLEVELSRLLSNKDERIQLGALARKRFEVEFQESAMNDAYLNLYNMLLEAKRVGR